MLTDTRVRSAKPTQRPIKLSDAGGLYLLIQPHGSKLWRMAYRFAGKQKTLALGVYPTVSLREAREKRDAAKRLLAKGIDPSAQPRLERQAARTPGSTFKDVAEELTLKLEREGRADATSPKSVGCSSLPIPQLVTARLPRSRRWNCFRFCAELNSEGVTKPPGDCAVPWAPFFAMPSPRAGPSLPTDGTGRHPAMLDWRPSQTRVNPGISLAERLLSAKTRGMISFGHASLATLALGELSCVALSRVSLHWHATFATSDGVA